MASPSRHSIWRNRYHFRILVVVVVVVATVIVEEAKVLFSNIHIDGCLWAGQGQERDYRAVALYNSYYFYYYYYNSYYYYYFYYYCYYLLLLLLLKPLLLLHGVYTIVKWTHISVHV